MRGLYAGNGNFTAARYLPAFRFRMRWPRQVRTFRPWDRWDPVAELDEHRGKTQWCNSGQGLQRQLLEFA